MKKSWWIATLLSLAPLTLLGEEPSAAYRSGETRLATLPAQRFAGSRNLIRYPVESNIAPAAPIAAKKAP